jgi:transcription antitermination factor NusG
MHSAAMAGYDQANPRGWWYALYTKHQHEKAVARNLSGKGFEIFLPLYPAARNWKDRVKLISLPLFPCYVFLHGDIERRLDILTTPGIHDLVSNAGQPAVIPAAEIEGIRQAVGSGARMEPHPFLKCGERVRVKCGPLAGLAGVLVRKKNVYRLVLSVEMLGKAAAVEIDAVLIERLTARPYASDSNLRAGTPASSEAGRQPVAKPNLAVA